MVNHLIEYLKGSGIEEIYTQDQKNTELQFYAVFQLESDILNITSKHKIQNNITFKLTYYDSYLDSQQSLQGYKFKIEKYIIENPLEIKNSEGIVINRFPIKMIQSTYEQTENSNIAISMFEIEMIVGESNGN